MKYIKFLFCATLYFSALTANATVTTWLGGTGNWDDDSNWDTGNAPSTNDGVIIPSGLVIVEGFEQAKYIHLDGGDLEVHGTLLVSPDTDWYPSSYARLRGIVIENGSSFDNYLNTIVLRGGNFADTGFLIYCNGNMTNHPNGFIFCSGDNSTGIHSYSLAGTIENYGEIAMQSVKTGLYMINPFRNYGDIEIGTYGGANLAVHNRESYYAASGSTLSANGIITMQENSEWIEHGNVEVNFTSNNNISVVLINGLLDIKTSGSFSVNGSFAPFEVDVEGTLRVRGDLSIDNDRPFASALTVQGAMINHQRGEVTTNAYYGVSNSMGGATQNYGIWRMNDTNFRSFKNSGTFSNRPKGKLYVQGRMELTQGSIFNNQGHMFASNDTFHIDLSGQFNNTGTLNDVDDRMSSISNNSGIRVYKKEGPFTEGVPVPNVLDVGGSPGATVLDWYTTSSGNTVAGTYNSSTNTITPNANAVGLSSLWVRTRINTGGITRRHELKVENGIIGSPSPLAQHYSNEHVLSKESFAIAPNPVHSQFSIIMEEDKEVQLNYSIYSMQGERLLSGKFQSNSNSIDIGSEFPGGMYFLHVTDSDKKTVDIKQIRVVR